MHKDEPKQFHLHVELPWQQNGTFFLSLPLSLPFKIHGDSYSFDIAESEYDNQIDLLPTSVKCKGIKLKKLFF